MLRRLSKHLRFDIARHRALFPSIHTTAGPILMADAAEAADAAAVKPSSALAPVSVSGSANLATPAATSIAVVNDASASPLYSGRVANLIVIDSHGRLTESRLPIAQVKHEARLLMREILVVEQASASVAPRIMPRRRAIVLTLGVLRAILLHDRVYIFSGASLRGAREYASALAAHISNADAAASAAAFAALGSDAQRDVTPFELTVMEHALLTQVQRQNRRIAFAKRLLERLLNKVGVAVDRDEGNLSALYVLSTTISHYETRSRQLIHCVRSLLEDDRDMREACLSEKRRIFHRTTPSASKEGANTSSSSGSDDHSLSKVSADALSQMELMLESVHQLAAETNESAAELARKIRTKQELLALQQSNNRNFILSFTLRMSVMSVALSSGTFITSAFGQNLAIGFGLESMPGSLALATAASVALCVGVYRQLDKLQTKNSPTQAAARRLAALQDVLGQLDSMVEAARETIVVATNEAAAAAASNPAPPSPAATPVERMESTFRNMVTREPVSGASAAKSDSLVASIRQLSRANFKLVHERTTGQPISEAEVDVLFELFDADSDGELGLDVLQTTTAVAALNKDAPAAIQHGIYNN